MNEFSTLMSPISIGKMQLRSRSIMPSMVTNYCNEDSSVTDKMVNYFAERAKNDVGLLILEAAYVDFCGKGFTNQVGIDKDELIPGLKKLTDAVHKAGGKIAVQIYHGGRQANAYVTGQPVVAPSPIPCPVMQSQPKEMSVEEIEAMIQRFADAADRAKRAGFDAIELHGAHGYLLNQFLSPNSNKRNDNYGGNAENRGRFPLEVLAAVRQRVGPDYPIIYRITTDEFLPDGLTIDDTVDFSKKLVENGVDAINVSGSTYVANRTSSGSDDILGLYVENAHRIKQAIDNKVPVSVANRIKTPAFAEGVLREGRADIVCTGRGLLCDAEFYTKAKAGHPEDIRECTSCNHCIDQLMSGHPISCLYNPLTGHEGQYDMSQKASEPKKLVVVGGGPSGMEAAYVAAQRGHDVTLFEQSDTLGGNVVPGTKPPYKNELFNVVAFLSHMLDKTGVRVRMNTAAELESIQAEKPDMVFLASGSRPIIPPIPGADGPNVCTAEDILLGRKEAEKRVVVIGGGSVGVETAELLAEKDCDVTVVEMLDEVLSDLSPTMKGGLLARAIPMLSEVAVGSRVLEITENGVKTDKGAYSGVDTVVLAVGYRSNNALASVLEQSGIPFKVIGDAEKPGKIYEAITTAFDAAYSL